MQACKMGRMDIIKLLLEQKGIDVNAKNVDLLYLIFYLIVLDFILIFGIYFHYSKQH